VAGCRVRASNKLFEPIPLAFGLQGGLAQSLVPLLGPTPNVPGSQPCLISQILDRTDDGAIETPANQSQVLAEAFLKPLYCLRPHSP
jgi:hypothetical protein